MAELPPELVPWRALLSLFPHELALALGGWVRRLALLAGPLPLSTATGSEEPDGYAGLSRRGSYERLLPAEWLLAEEMPDEFLRRAAMQEQLFLRLAYSHPHGDRNTTLLFDSGPTQLGGPRLVHLAALVLFAERASRGGASFGWGVLQQPEAGLSSEVSEHSFSRLLAARTTDEVSSEHLACWQEALPPPRALDDLWWVGPARLRPLASRTTSLLTIEDVLRPDVTSVRVESHRPGAWSRYVDLDLPGAGECVRLLRNPFEVHPPPRLAGTTPFHVEAGVRFSRDGHRLLARRRGETDGVVAFHVPNSTRDRVGHPRRLGVPAGEEILAVGWERKRFVFVTLTLDAIHLYLPVGRDARRRLTFPLPAGVRPVPPARGRPIPPCYLARGSREPAALLLDAKGMALQIAPQEAAPVVRLWERAFAIAPTERGLACLAEQVGEGGRTCILASWTGPHGVRPLRYLPHPAVVEAHVGSSPARDHPDGVLLAIRGSEDTWSIVERTQMTSVRPEDGDLVVGVGTTWHKRRTTGLIVLSPDRRTLSLRAPHESHALRRMAAPIHGVAVSSTTPRIALVLESGGLLVFSLVSTSTLLEVAPEGAV